MRKIAYIVFVLLACVVFVPRLRVDRVSFQKFTMDQVDFWWADWISMSVSLGSALDSLHDTLRFPAGRNASGYPLCPPRLRRLHQTVLVRYLHPRLLI